MSHLRALLAFMLVLAGIWSMAALAAPTKPADFAVEMVLEESLPTDRALEITCTVGCEWRKRTVECAEGASGCRAVIAGRLDYDSRVVQPDPPPRPVRDSVCTGLTFWSNTVESVMACEPRSDDANRKICRRVKAPKSAPVNTVLHVQEGSPADAAHVRPGDRLVSFNGKRVRSAQDLTTILKDRAGGDSFEAVVSRESGQKGESSRKKLQGRLGTLLSDTRCAQPEDPALRLPAITLAELNAMRFEIDLALPQAGATFYCLKGCVWPRIATGELAPDSRVTVDRTGFSKYVPLVQKTVIPAPAPAPAPVPAP